MDKSGQGLLKFPKPFASLSVNSTSNASSLLIYQAASATNPDVKPEAFGKTACFVYLVAADKKLPLEHSLVGMIGQMPKRRSNHAFSSQLSSHARSRKDISLRRKDPNVKQAKQAPMHHSETRQSALEGHNVPTSALQQSKETKKWLHSDLLKFRVPPFFQIDITFVCHLSVDRTSPTIRPIEQRRVLGATDGWIGGWQAERLAG